MFGVSHILRPSSARLKVGRKLTLEEAVKLAME